MTPRNHQSRGEESCRVKLNGVGIREDGKVGR